MCFVMSCVDDCLNVAVRVCIYLHSTFKLGMIVCIVELTLEFDCNNTKKLNPTTPINQRIELDDCHNQPPSKC